MAKARLDQKLQAWIEARKRYRLSHAQVQMARELGLNPRKLGALANHDEQPWKAPLPVFIERIYEKQFGRKRPQSDASIEERIRLQAEKKAARRAERARARAADAAGDLSAARPDAATQRSD